MMAADVSKLLQRWQALKNERSGWDASWEQLAELFLPTRWRSDSDTSAHKTPRINGRLLNSTGVLAMRTLAAGMHGGMTSPVRPWFRIVRKGGEQEQDGLHEWLDTVTQAMQSVLQQSNFYNAVHALYSDLGTFGTALMVETANEDGIQFHLVRCGEYVLDVDGQNRVDTFIRRMYLTAKQMAELWPSTCPEKIKELANAGKHSGNEERFNVFHAVYPRRDFDPKAKISPESKAWSSVYFCAEGQTSGKGTVLDEGGYDMFPAFAPRWDVNGTDVYGRSPAMDVTPDCRMLQAMTSTMRRMQHKMADPPMIADSSLRKYGISLDPGSLNFASLSEVSQAVGGIQPIQQPSPQALQYTMQAVDDIGKTIEDGLYTDLFRLLIDNDRRNITATEIQAKQQEKMILIGPVVERLHKELLEPVIMRTFALMREWGALPEPPDGIEGLQLDVTFESVLAQAQKVTATSSMDQAFAFIAGTAQAYPEILDIIDYDELGREYVERIGAPSSILRDDDEIAMLRQQRAEQQAAMQQQAEAAQQVQSLKGMADAAKAAGSTPVGADGQTLMQSLVGGLGGM